MNVELLKLHEHLNYSKDCCSLLNDEWPRSETARMHSLCKSSDNLPISFILVDIHLNTVIAHIRVKKDVLSNNAAVVESLVVRKEYRGKGHGKYMMNEAEQFIKEMGFATIKLTTKDKVAFYEKLGYKSNTENNKLSGCATKAHSNSNHCYLNECRPAPSPPPPPPLDVNTSNNVFNIHKTIELQKKLM